MCGHAHVHCPLTAVSGCESVCGGLPLTRGGGLGASQEYSAPRLPEHEWLCVTNGTGLHDGRVEVLPNGTLKTVLKWQDPLGGEGEDQYVLKDHNTLHVISKVKVGAQTCAYTTVYHRKR